MRSCRAAYGCGLCCDRPRSSRSNSARSRTGSASSGLACVPIPLTTGRPIQGARCASCTTSDAPLRMDLRDASDLPLPGVRDVSSCARAVAAGAVSSGMGRPRHSFFRAAHVCEQCARSGSRAASASLLGVGMNPRCPAAAVPFVVWCFQTTTSVGFSPTPRAPFKATAHCESLSAMATRSASATSTVVDSAPSSSCPVGLWMRTCRVRPYGRRCGDSWRRICASSNRRCRGLWSPQRRES